MDIEINRQVNGGCRDAGNGCGINGHTRCSIDQARPEHGAAQRCTFQIKCVIALSRCAMTSISIPCDEHIVNGDRIIVRIRDGNGHCVARLGKYARGRDLTTLADRGSGSRGSRRDHGDCPSGRCGGWECGRPSSC